MSIRLLIARFLDWLFGWSEKPQEPREEPERPVEPPAPEPAPEPAPAPVPDPPAPAPEPAPEPPPSPIPPAPVPPAPTPPPMVSDKLIAALIRVESGGDDNAIGDRNLVHKAYGPLQIRQPYVDDVNRILKTHYTAQQMLGNRALSITMLRAYMSIYATQKRLGRPVTDEDIARIHNGGPNGWRSPATVGYWTKVKKYL